MNTKSALGASVLAAAIALTACDPPAATPSGSGAPAPAPAITVTVSVTPSPSPAPAEPDFDFTHFRGAQIGTTWAEMGAALHTAVGGYDEYDATCTWYGPLWSTSRVITHAFTDAHSAALGASSDSTFFYTQAISDLTGPFPRNAEGVGVGSTKAEVLAAYPGAVVGSVDDLGAGHIVTITVNDPAGSGSKYVFGIDGGFGDPNTIDLLQWGPGAGGQFSHLCTGF